jgi:hypothetical protein
MQPGRLLAYVHNRSFGSNRYIRSTYIDRHTLIATNDTAVAIAHTSPHDPTVKHAVITFMPAVLND